MANKGPQPSTLRQHAEAVENAANRLHMHCREYHTASMTTRQLDRRIMREEIGIIRQRLGALEFLLDEHMAKGE